NRVIGRGASTRDRVIRAGIAPADGDLSGSNVCDKAWDEEGTDTPGAALAQDVMFLFNSGKAADAGSDDDADAIGVKLRGVQTRIADGHIRGGEGKLRDAVHPADGFLIDIFFVFVPFDFGVNLAGIVGGIKEREASYYRPSVLEAIPKGL